MVIMRQKCFCLDHAIIIIPLSGFQGKNKEEDLTHAFVETYLSFPTKAEQFASFKSFGDQVMNIGDAHDRTVLTGERSVRNLERKLVKVNIWLHTFCNQI